MPAFLQRTVLAILWADDAWTWSSAAIGDAWAWLGHNATPLEALATAVGAAGAIILGVATYRVSSYLHAIEQERNERERKAFELAAARARPRLDIYDGVSEHADRWAVQVRNPGDAPDLLDVRGVIVHPDGTKREMQSERGRVLVAGTEAVFTFPAGRDWFVRCGGSHELAAGVRIVFYAQDGSILAERIG